MANVVLTTVVADQSVARTQSPEDVAKMALASDVVVEQVSRQLPMPGGRSPTTDARKIAPCLARKGSGSLRRKCSSSLNWKFHELCVV